MPDTSTTSDAEKLWGGRFAKPTDAGVEAFGASIRYDRRLWAEDIAGSIAHARMLARIGLLSEVEAAQIVDGLELIHAEIADGKFPFDPANEDIHLNIEARLRELIGEPAGKLHTARSRNDQVATDLRLWTKSAIDHLRAAVRELATTLVDQAEAHSDVLLPGYTHLQRGQPVLLAHHWLAFVEMLRRDDQRLAEAWRRADVLPLGSGALAGSPYPLDREFVAQELGFAAISRNSMDAVGDRDFVVDTVYACALLMTHLSRLAEEIILWSSSEFGFIVLDDAFATGSSLMPQKKNPDVAELTRGRSGRVYGHLVGLLTMLKGLPLAYNRDLQEDKEALFDTVDTVLPVLRVGAGLLRTVRVQRETMARAANEGYILATDLADYLVRKGLPFREAHGVVGHLVGECDQRGLGLKQLSLADYQRHSPLFEADILELDARRSADSRDVPGGTATPRVRAALAEARAWLESAAIS